MAETKILNTVREFVTDNFLYATPDLALGESDSLLRRGIVDSMGVLELLTFLEATFDITIPDDEVTEANLGSLRAISRFVMAKRSALNAA